MENAGKASKAVVKRLIEDIRFFADAVREQSGKMMDEAIGLHSQWDDPQYDTFEKYMRQLTEDLVRDTQELDYCADQLEERELREI